MTNIDRDDADRLAKLPTWARRLVEGLDRQLTEAQADVARLQEGSVTEPDRQKFFVKDPDPRVRGRFWLPPYDVLSYAPDPSLADDHTRRLEITQSHRFEGGIEVRVPDGMITVTPEVNNAVHIVPTIRAGVRFS